MTSIKSPANDAPANLQPWDIPKVRPCLRCETSFSSTWSGDRICPRCKGSKAWKDGVPLSSRSMGHTR